MKYIYSIVALFVSFSLLAQATSREEQMLESLKQAGIVRQEGKTIIYKVQKASDTAKVRLLYGNLFNNPNYNVRFEVDGKTYNQTKTSPIQTTQNGNNVVNNQTPVNNTPSASVTGIVNNNNQGCFTNMLVFGENRYREDIKKYEWVVPQLVTKIKIECWSGGGNGFFLGIDKDSLGNKAGGRSGSGGGGGGYALAVVDVKPGDIIKMNIPGGGGRKSVLIQINDVLNSLLVGNGSDGITGFGAGYDGKGGFVSSQNIRGIFEGKVFSLTGENGSFHSIIESQYYYYEYFGNGGAAAKLNNGGRGGKLSELIRTRAATYTNSTNGGFPGGGGGAGFSNNRIPIAEREEGKGAPGIVIIYY